MALSATSDEEFCPTSRSLALTTLSHERNPTFFREHKFFAVAARESRHFYEASVSRAGVYSQGRRRAGRLLQRRLLLASAPKTAHRSGDAGSC